MEPGNTGALDTQRTEDCEAPARSQYLGEVTQSDVPERYELGVKIGEGGMGVVYRAYDRVLDREVAIKLLAATRLGREPERAEARLLREAQAIARLAHPNVVNVFEAQRYGASVYIAMEYVAGPTLRDWIRTRPDWRRVVGVFVQAGAALAAAHEVDLVHRDFKPANVIVADDGRVRVLDFGLARASGQSSGRATDQSHDEGSRLTEVVTGHGVLLGTPAYMSPEQHAGDPAQAASDQYAFCVALYEALYGKRPFDASSQARMIQAKQRDRLPPRPSRHGVPRALHAVLVRGLSSDPIKRWPTMRELLHAVQRVESRVRRRTALLGFSGAAIAVGWLSLSAGALPDARACDGGQAELAHYWHEERRASIEASILATDLPNAHETRERVLDAIDRYGGSWVSTYRGTCEAAATDPEHVALLDARILCMREALHALDAYATQLEVIAPATLQRAAAASAELPDVARCTASDLSGVADASLSPELASAAAALRRERDAMVQLHAFGRFTEAADLGEDLLRHARALDYPVLVAEIGYAWARSLLEVGRRDEARQHMMDAYFVAADAGHARDALERAASLVQMFAQQPDGLDDAFQWRKRVGALAEQVDAPLQVAYADSRLAVGLRLAGRYDEAVEHARAGLEVAERVVGDRGAIMLTFHTHLAGPLVMRGELAAGIEQLDNALAAAQSALGPTHPHTAVVHVNLGDTLRKQGQVERAIEHLQTASEILASTYGPRSEKVAHAAVNLGIAFETLDRDDEAVERWRFARSVLEETSPNSSALASVCNNLGRHVSSSGDTVEGRALLEHALAIREDELGPEHPRVADVLTNLGLNRMLADDLPAAAAYLDRSVTLLAKAHGEDNSALITPSRMLADVEARQGDCAAAVERYRRVQEMLVGAEGVEDEAGRIRAGLQRCVDSP